MTKNQIKKKQQASNDESRLDSLIQRLVRRWLAEQETSLSANRIEQFVAWVGADAERSRERHPAPLDGALWTLPRAR